MIKGIEIKGIRKLIVASEGIVAVFILALVSKLTLFALLGIVAIPAMFFGFNIYTDHFKASK